MSAEICEFLAGFLQSGACLIGEVHISGDYRLCHIEDSAKRELRVFADPHDAIEIARYDDSGNYRPLKTAPNLRHGWLLELRSLREAVLALDFLYPAALGTALAFTRNDLKSVNLRETLARQTGMYAVTKKISDAQAESTVARTCNHRDGCLRHILWSISPGHTTSLSRQTSKIPCSKSEIPILCAEACNLLVAAARRTVKAPAA
jgi:sirohydrochlorin cobaltochelatase